jgi:hypothetical protein
VSSNQIAGAKAAIVVVSMLVSIDFGRQAALAIRRSNSPADPLFTRHNWTVA